MEQKRSTFSGRLGFVLAAAGSAVGLGNIWRFPYLAAKYGGGIFLLVYIILTLTFGFTLMTAEIAIGRKTGQSPIGAFRALDKRFTFVGYLGAIVPMIILPYYSVIGGWVTKYFCTYASGMGKVTVADSYFGSFTGSTIEPLGWFLLYLAITSLVVLLGVEKGIEKVSKIMMPVLIFLTLGISVYGLCLPGAIDGLLYYVTPNFADFSVKTVLAAMGQLFYSMSIAMGIMITYGSYMKKDVNLVSSVKQIELFDTGIAFLAGLMIVPSVFVFSGGDKSALSAGPGLMFKTLPKVFDSMPAGNLIGAAFFLLVLFAALTSSISLMETVVSVCQDKFKWNRKLSCLAVFLVAIVLGVPSSLGNGIWENIRLLGMQFLDFFDFISNSVIMPIVALITSIFVGYIIKPSSVIEEVELSAKFKNKNLFVAVIKYVAPICIVLILVSSVLGAFGILKI